MRLSCGAKDSDKVANWIDAILARSAEVKAALYGGQVFVIVPIYMTSICQEQCLYCNFRGGNKGIEVERRRLTENELEQEATFLVEQKGTEFSSWCTQPIRVCGSMRCAATLNFCDAY